MLTGLKAEQARAALTNKEVAEALGIAVNTYIYKKRTGKFYLDEMELSRIVQSKKHPKFLIDYCAVCRLQSL